MVAGERPLYSCTTLYHLYYWYLISLVFNFAFFAIVKIEKFFYLKTCEKILAKSREDKGDREGIPHTHPIP